MSGTRLYFVDIDLGISAGLGGYPAPGLSFVDSDGVVSTIVAEVICPLCQISTCPSISGRIKQYLVKK